MDQNIEKVVNLTVMPHVLSPRSGDRLGLETGKSNRDYRLGESARKSRWV